MGNLGKKNLLNLSVQSNFQYIKSHPYYNIIKYFHIKSHVKMIFAKFVYFENEYKYDNLTTFES